MLTDSGVGHIRLRGTNPHLSNMLPGLYQLGQRCTSFGSFLDEAVRYLGTVNLSIMTLEYNAGTKEVTLMVKG